MSKIPLLHQQGVGLARIQQQIEATLEAIAKQEALGKNPVAQKANYLRLVEQLAVAEEQGRAPATTVEQVHDSLKIVKQAIADPNALAALPENVQGVIASVPTMVTDVQPALQAGVGNMAIVELQIIAEQLAPTVLQLLVQLGVYVALAEIVDYIQESGVTDVQSLVNYFRENYKGAAGSGGMDPMMHLRASITTGPKAQFLIGQARIALQKDPLCYYWRPVTREKWFKKKKEIINGYYKHYLFLTEEEVRAFHMAQYRTMVFWKSKGNESYVRGYNNGARAQQRKEIAVESGATPAVRYYSKKR